MHFSIFFFSIYRNPIESNPLITILTWSVDFDSLPLYDDGEMSEGMITKKPAYIWDDSDHDPYPNVEGRADASLPQNLVENLTELHMHHSYGQGETLAGRTVFGWLVRASV